MLDTAKLWLKQVLNDLFGQKREEPEELDDPNLQPMERCKRIYSRLDITGLQNYRKSTATSMKINVVHNNIEALISDLEEHMDQINANGVVHPPQCNYTARELSLNRFLTAADGCYLESRYEAMQTLRTKVLRLITTIEQSHHEVAEAPVYNKRMLNALFFVLVDIGLTLNQANQVAVARSV